MVFIIPAREGLWTILNAAHAAPFLVFLYSTEQRGRCASLEYQPGDLAAMLPHCARA